jgi:hypothetical protein
VRSHGNSAAKCWAMRPPYEVPMMRST